MLRGEYGSGKARDYVQRSRDWDIGVAKEAICLSFKDRTKVLNHQYISFHERRVSSAMTFRAAVLTSL